MHPTPCLRHICRVGRTPTAPLRAIRRLRSTCSIRYGGSIPLYGIRNILRTGRDKLTERQKQRLEDAFTEREEHLEVDVAWQCAQQLRDAYQHPDLTGGRQIAERVVDTFHTCPIPEIARLGRTLRQWREPFLSYWDTARSSNGGTEAINRLIELARRVARGFTNLDNYRLRMLLVAGGLDPVTPT